MKIKDIKTDRLVIRAFTKDEAIWAYKIWNDPEMGKYLRMKQWKKWIVNT